VSIGLWSYRSGLNHLGFRAGEGKEKRVSRGKEQITSHQESRQYFPRPYLKIGLTGHNELTIMVIKKRRGL
jgi:hypothetical protein